MRQRKFHPPFVVKIETGYEIEQTRWVPGDWYPYRDRKSKIITWY
jgi:hypothetical protein